MDIEKAFLISLIGFLGALSAFMLWPFSGFILAAIMLSFVLFPLQERLEPYLGAQLAAGILVLASIVLITVPLAFTTNAVIEDARSLSQGINQTEFIDTSVTEDFIKEYTGQKVDIRASFDSLVTRFTNITIGGFSQFISTLVHITLGVFLTVFLMYYFLKDGEKFVEWVRESTPLPSHLQDDLYQKIDQSTWAVIKGHVFVAVLQGIVAGVGLLVTGVPNSAFWTFVMVILAFIPIIGTFVVWGPASIYLFAVGRPSAGFFLAIYGFLIVSLIDNFVRPLAVDRGSDLHPAVILAGVLGGVYLFGAAGLFIGPILMGIFKSAIVVFRQNYQEL